MEILIKASQFILSLSLLIVLHELGHFIPAKLFKTKVEKFYLFFDYKFSLFKKKVGETVYGIGWIPLGGYVKIAGMIDESMDTEQLKEDPKPWEFRSKPAWQRLIIMLGGVIVNFILGWLIYVGVTAYWGDTNIAPDGVKNGFAVAEFMKPYGFESGDKVLKINGETPEDVSDINKFLFLRDVKTVDVQHTNGTTETLSVPENIGSIMWKNGDMQPFRERIFQPVIDTVITDQLAEKAGILKGDKIVAVNGTKIDYWEEFMKLTQGSNEKLSLEIERKGEDECKKFEISFKNIEEKKIGVAPNSDIEVYKAALETYHKDYSLGESFAVGSSKAYWTLKDYISQFKYVFTKKGAQSVGGFISIGKIFPSIWSWKSFWNITALLSIMLGFMNLLPIPALDGGHVVFTLWEMITGKKPGDKFLEYAQMVGFVILIALLLLANGNDIVKLFK
ncbi:RIP metalloprotease RseP [Tenacibaculum sp. M341]|uniref:RIP metalloprotease RseP n=1 Tax=Tenacibaculum sp. M341 TaxID=2530339 RepID=UPI00104E1492|nr:RIP metalloprotease RseP [Tenacibaculum sp. M341]TCI93088.1 RIP metalloprotease RseP [Tenacibaculum sp. M341]